MDRVEQLWLFVAPPKSGCPTFSVYLPHYSDQTFTDVFNEAVDYLDAQLKAGHGPAQGTAHCDATTYRIDPGPILGPRT